MARSSSTVEGRLSQLMSKDNSLQERTILAAYDGSPLAGAGERLDLLVVGSRGYGPVPSHLKLEGATA